MRKYEKEEYSSMLTMTSRSFMQFIALCGDVNLHFESAQDGFAQRFLSQLGDFGFSDYIGCRPTHRRGGSLDVVLSSGVDCKDIVVEDLQISDHYPIFFTASIPNDKQIGQQKSEKPRYYNYRDLKSIDCPEFLSYASEKLTQLSNYALTCSSSDDLALRFVDFLKTSLDDFAPISVRKTSQNKSSSFPYDPVVADAKRYRRQLERKFIKSKSEIDKQMLNDQRNVVRKLAFNNKARVIREKISNATNSSKVLYKTVRKLTSCEDNDVLPDHVDDQSLSESFSNFFEQKVQKIVSEFSVDDVGSVDLTLEKSTRGNAVFDEFRELDEQSVDKLRPLKCSQLDFLPIAVYKKIWPLMLPIVTKIVNLTLSSGKFPDIFKTAHVRPLIKSYGLDHNSLSSYRPVSNLSFVSKVVETAINNQLQEHLTSNNLLSPVQSAYRKGHSVETALSHVHSSIVSQLDKGHTVFLVLLDLSAAFDTVSHHQLLSLLKSRFGIMSTALNTLQSYLTNRFSRVSINSSLSNPRQFSVGVPQGSILGPVLFNCIMSGLPSLLANIGVNSHMYADDTQFWFSFPPSDETHAREVVQRTFGIITEFMKSNFLKLNPNKTVFLPISRSNPHTNYLPLKLNESTLIPPSKSARNLGVVFDCNLNFRKHISALRKSCFYELKRLTTVRCFIPRNSFESVIHSYVTSKLDFCNILFNGLPDVDLNNIQSILNACAKTVTKAKRYDSASEQLKTLHWLPIVQRAKYKCLLFCHKLAHKDSNLPQYFKEHDTNIKVPSRITRSSSGILLHSSFRPKLMSTSSRCFQSCGVDLWNKLPIHIRNIKSYSSFKKHIKTILFTEFYC